MLGRNKIWNRYHPVYSSAGPVCKDSPLRDKLDRKMNYDQLEKHLSRKTDKLYEAEKKIDAVTHHIFVVKVHLSFQN